MKFIMDLESMAYCVFKKNIRGPTHTQGKVSYVGSPWRRSLAYLNFALCLQLEAISARELSMVEASAVAMTIFSLRHTSQRREPHFIELNYVDH